MEHDIRRAIKEYVIKELNPKVAVDYESPLVQQGIIDSLAIFMLIGFIMDEFGVQIDPDDVSLSNFETINAIEKLVVGAQSSPPPGVQRK